jgi:hypothetical protein
MRSRHTERVVGVRLTGSEADVFAALTALGLACPGGWNLEVKTPKTRDTGQIQAYGRLVKHREAR